MPKIFEQDGFTFFFYMNEHLPVHVHVMRQGKKAKLEIVGGKAVAVIPGRLSVSDLKKAERIASENSGLIADRWRETFDK